MYQEQITSESFDQEGVIKELLESFEDQIDVDALQQVTSSDDTPNDETWYTLEPSAYVDHGDESICTLEPVADVDHTSIDETINEITHQEQAQIDQEGRGRKRPREAEYNDENVPPKKIHKCSSCEKTFTRAANLKRHQKIHSEKEKNFECSYCQKI